MTTNGGNQNGSTKQKVATRGNDFKSSLRKTFSRNYFKTLPPVATVATPLRPASNFP